MKFVIFPVNPPSVETGASKVGAIVGVIVVVAVPIAVWINTLFGLITLVA